MSPLSAQVSRTWRPFKRRWMLRNEERTGRGAGAITARPSPLLIDYCLCTQRAGVLRCRWCLGRADHLVGCFVEDIPAVIVLLWALSHAANSTLRGDTPVSISVRCPPLGPLSVQPLSESLAVRRKNPPPPPFTPGEFEDH